MKRKNIKILIHCFTGTREFAFKLLDLGAYISASGVVTFNKSQDLANTFKDIPNERILVETDAPYLAPVPLRGKSNEPSYIIHTVKFLSKIKKLSFDDFSNITTNNFFQFIWKIKLKNKFTILGCGSSLGSPWITNYNGKLRKSSKNLRTRCCAHIQRGNLSVLIDTSPDIKSQFLKNKIKNLDSIIYTHEHADQTAGIFEMRPFFWKNKTKIPIYGSRRTIKALKKPIDFVFKRNKDISQ